MESPAHDPPRPSFAQVMSELSQLSETTSLGEILHRLRSRGYGMFFLILSLPSALPVPALGYSTPFGLVLAGLAIQLLAARKEPWLPQKVGQLKLSESFLKKMCGALNFIFKYTQFLVRPRWRFVIFPFGTHVAGLMILLMSGLMIIPIPGTNTFPAGVIFITGLALLEEDGALMLLALTLGALATLFYATLIALIYTYGLGGLSEAWRLLTEPIETRLSL
jgi:hypothetical protein